NRGGGRARRTAAAPAARRVRPWWTDGALLLRLRGRLHGLLRLAHLRECPRARDVRDRAERSLFAVVASRLAPAGSGEPALLAEQCEEDARFLVAEPGQLLQPLQHLSAGRIPVGPDRGRVAAPFRDNLLAELLYAARHGSGVAMHRGRLAEDLDERLRVV